MIAMTTRPLLSPDAPIEMRLADRKARTDALIEAFGVEISAAMERDICIRNIKDRARAMLRGELLFGFCPRARRIAERVRRIEARRSARAAA